MFSMKRPLSESGMEETFETVLKNNQHSEQLGFLLDKHEDNEETGFLKNLLKSIRETLGEWHHYLVEEGLTDEHTSYLTPFKTFLDKQENHRMFNELEKLTNDSEWSKHASFIQELLPLLKEWSKVTEDIKKATEGDSSTSLNNEERQLYQLLEVWEEALNEDSSETKAVLDLMGFIQVDVPILDEKIFNHQTAEALEVLRQVVTQAAENQMPASSSKQTGALLAALEQWVTMTQEMDEQIIQQQMNKVLSELERKLIDHLVQRYQKKSALAGKKMYEQEAKVTKADVKKWMSQALKKYASPKSESKWQGAVLAVSEEDSTLSMQHFMPVSKKEQWIALASFSSRVEEISNQLVRKITTALQHNPFLKNAKQPQALTISLQPAHLGDITMKMAQVNGEMTVQLLTASKAAKELLESNVTQLRHLFAPHQISIDREEQVSEEEHGFEEENPEQANDEEKKKKESEKREQETEKDHTQADFHTLLHRLGEKEVVDEPLY